MAFVNFYLVAGGAGSADINAGSSIGAAQATTTNGSWNSGTGVFIAASGTPFAATQVGDYASVYVDGATVTTFVGKVTTVTSSTQITVDVATIKYGTVPSTSATGRSCTINGSWNTEQVLAAGGLASTTVPQSTKINITGNLTTTATRTISMAGATTTPLWFSGYNTTPGDLDNDTTNALAKPIWTLGATFLLQATGAHQWWSSLNVVANRNSAAWQTQGTGFLMVRTRIENTSSGSNAFALDVTNNTGQRYAYCWFKVPATATGSGNVVVGTGLVSFVGCVSDGGGKAAYDGSNQSPEYLACVALNGVVGFLSTTSRLAILNCTISNISGDGVKSTGTPSGGSIVVGSLFRSIGGYGINNASGTNTNLVIRTCNDFYSCTSGAENGFGDSPAFFGQTDLSDPVTSASDMTPVSGSNARNNGFPGIFENQSYSSYPAIGAVTPQATGLNLYAVE